MKKIKVLVLILSVFCFMKTVSAEGPYCEPDFDTTGFKYWKSAMNGVDVGDYGEQTCCFLSEDDEDSMCDYYILAENVEEDPSDENPSDENPGEEGPGEDIPSENPDDGDQTEDPGDNEEGGGGSSSGNGGLTSDPYEDDNIFGDNGDSGDFNCKTIFVKKESPDGDVEFTELGKFMNDLFALIKIATPVLVIALSTIDYVKAIANSNADEMKRANSRTVKRLVIGLIIFVLPFLLEVLFRLFGLYDLSTCGIGT